MDALISVAVIFVVTMLYFAPAIIVAKKEAGDPVMWFIVNLLFAWTFIVWFVMLIIAICKKDNSDPKETLNLRQKATEKPKEESEPKVTPESNESLIKDLKYELLQSNNKLEKLERRFDYVVNELTYYLSSEDSDNHELARRLKQSYIEGIYKNV